MEDLRRVVEPNSEQPLRLVGCLPQLPSRELVPAASTGSSPWILGMLQCTDACYGQRRGLRKPVDESPEPENQKQLTALSMDHYRVNELTLGAFRSCRTQNLRVSYFYAGNGARPALSGLKCSLEVLTRFRSTRSAKLSLPPAESITHERIRLRRLPSRPGM